LTQNWSTLGFLTKLLATLGVGIAAYIAAVILSRNQKTEAIGLILYLIFAVMSPVGILAIIEQAGFDANTFSWQSVISGIMLTVFCCRGGFFAKIYLFFSTLFGTSFFFFLTSWMASGSFSDERKFYCYLFLTIGAVYLLMAIIFKKRTE